MGKDFWMYSITLQPEQDGPEQLAEYAKEHGCRMDETLVLFVVPDPRPAGEISDDRNR